MCFVLALAIDPDRLRFLAMWQQMYLRTRCPRVIPSLLVCNLTCSSVSQSPQLVVGRSPLCPSTSGTDHVRTSSTQLTRRTMLRCARDPKADKRSTAQELRMTEADRVTRYASGRKSCAVFKHLFHARRQHTTPQTSLVVLNPIFPSSFNPHLFKSCVLSKRRTKLTSQLFRPFFTPFNPSSL